MTQKQNNNEQKKIFKHFVGGGEAEMKIENVLSCHHFSLYCQTECI